MGPAHSGSSGLSQEADGGGEECGFVDVLAGSRGCLHLEASVFSGRLLGKSPADSQGTGGLRRWRRSAIL